MNAKQFRNQYARDRGHINWDCMVDDTNTVKLSALEDDVMEKYADHKSNLITTGVKLIVEERIEQLNKHSRSIQQDVELNTDHQLSYAASILSEKDFHMSEEDTIKFHCPKGWNDSIWSKMVKKPYKERLVIAGALIAAEIDRLNQD